MTTSEQHLHGQLIESQRRYAYFLLAAAASAVALAVNQTREAALTSAQVPLGLAVACWGLSFFFGCRHLAYMQATMRANAALLQIESGTYPGLPNHPDHISAAASGTRKATESNSESANTNSKLQFRLLIAGALLYLAWHLLQMALRTPGLPAKLGIGG